MSIKDFRAKLLNQFNIALLPSHDYLRINKEKANASPKQHTRVAPVGRSSLKDKTSPDKLVPALTRVPIINWEKKLGENRAPITAGTIKNVKIRNIPAVFTEVTMIMPSVK